MAKENNHGANLGFESELWRAADALRSNMDAAEYLKSLEKIAIMKTMRVGKETLYLNVGLYDLLSH
jgi:hypothetical protein